MPQQSMLFTEREMQVLAAICDTLVPALDVTPDPGGLYRRKASDLNVPGAIATAIETAIDPDSQPPRPVEGRGPASLAMVTVASPLPRVVA